MNSVSWLDVRQCWHVYIGKTGKIYSSGSARWRWWWQWQTDGSRIKSKWKIIYRNTAINSCRQCQYTYHEFLKLFSTSGFAEFSFALHFALVRRPCVLCVSISDNQHPIYFSIEIGSFVYLKEEKSPPSIWCIDRFHFNAPSTLFNFIFYMLLISSSLPLVDDLVLLANMISQPPWEKNSKNWLNLFFPLILFRKIKYNLTLFSSHDSCPHIFDRKVCYISRAHFKISTYSIYYMAKLCSKSHNKWQKTDGLTQFGGYSLIFVQIRSQIQENQSKFGFWAIFSLWMSYNDFARRCVRKSKLIEIAFTIVAKKNSLSVPILKCCGWDKANLTKEEKNKKWIFFFLPDFLFPTYSRSIGSSLMGIENEKRE